ncbi:facilitated trehalose transporter Tret1-2 homolog [Periplaneta americana]|uniref:facilitated trehalose transporter Tret1-2 homolog n=1 Tax=Periplaneta americana TaxID=6978 RepID=UPI0037E6FCC0
MGEDASNDERTSRRGIKEWFSSGMVHQALHVGAVALYGCTLGASMGYSAVLLPQVQANTSSIPIDENMGAWIASIHSGVSPVGFLTGGLVMDRWGRRFTMRVGLVPIFLGYLIIAFAPSYPVVMVGRFITALSSGFSTAASSIILSEIATPRLRKTYESSMFTALSVGVLLVYVLGTYLQWQVVAGLLTVPPLTSLIVFIFVPETPVWLAKKERLEEAEEALTWLRGNEDKAKLELQDILSTLREQEEDDTDSDSSDDEDNRKSKSKIIHKIQLLLSPQYFKPFIIAHVFNLLQILTGTLLFVFYAVDIISQMNKNAEGFSCHYIAQLTAFVRLVFTVATNVFLNRVFRRTHIIVASSVCAVTALILSCFLYVQYKSQKSSPTGVNLWLTAVLILMFLTANTCAFFPLPSRIMSEILPLKIRDFGSGYIYVANEILQFFVSKTYPQLKGAIGNHGIFLLIGINSLLCVIFSYLFLPETRRKSLVQIEEYFRGPNLLWIKRDRRLGRDYTRKKYFEMKKTNVSKSARAYTDQEEEKDVVPVDKKKLAKRKLSVTFSGDD